MLFLINAVIVFSDNAYSKDKNIIIFNYVSSLSK